MLYRGDYSEKRDFMRMEVGCAMQFRIYGDGDMYQATVRDLSASGLGFVSQQGVLEGATLELIVSPEKAITPPLHARAEVVRVVQQGPSEWEIGVKIVEHLS